MINTSQTQQPTFKDNWNFQLNYYKTVETLLKRNAEYFISVSVATQEQDMKRATDFVVKIEGGDIAVRIRRKYYKYRDLTIRSKNGIYKTEIDKLKEGWARYYLYCWETDDSKIDEWMLVDMNMVRTMKLLEGRQEKYNKDGKTAFICIPFHELNNNNCILASNISV